MENVYVFVYSISSTLSLEKYGLNLMIVHGEDSVRIPLEIAISVRVVDAKKVQGHVPFILGFAISPRRS